MFAVFTRCRIGMAVFSDCLGPDRILKIKDYRRLRTTSCRLKRSNNSKLPSSTSRKMKNLEFVKKWNMESTLLYGPKLNVHKNTSQKRAAESNISIDFATHSDAIAKAENGPRTNTSNAMPPEDNRILTDIEAPTVKETANTVSPKRGKKTATPRRPKAALSLPPSSVVPGEFPELDRVLQFPLFRPSASLTGKVTTEVEALTALTPPRVTRVLDQTRSEQSQMFLNRWIQQQIELLGKEEFGKAQQKRLRVASSLHGCIEQFLLGTPEHLLNLDDNILPYWDSLHGALGGVEDVFGVEVKLEHSNLRYMGAADCIGKYRGELCVIDWKTSSKLKPSIGDLFDYPLQVAAYLGALHFNRLGPLSDNQNDVMNLLIVVAYEDGSPAHAHYIPRLQALRFWGEWTKRLHQYWAGVFSEQLTVKR